MSDLLRTQFDALLTQAPQPIVGRDRELAELRQLLVETTARTVALVAPVGMGKTTLAAQFARSLLAQDHHVEYLSAFDVLEAKLPAIPDTLYVVQDVHALRQPERLRAVISKRPAGSRYLLLAERPVPWADATVTLGPLSHDTLTELWQAQMFSPSQSDAAALAALSQGNPAIAELLGRLVRDGVHTAAHLADLLRTFRHPGLVDAKGSPLRDTDAERQVVADLVLANNSLLSHLEQHPEDLHRLTPTEFEDLVAEVLARQGYDVHQTPVSKDGGKDLYVASKSGLLSALYAVECKRYSPSNPVGVEIVRALHGVVQAERLTGGIVATTSRFTRGATQFREQVKYQLSLSDYVGVHAWIKQALHRDRAV